MIVAIKREYRSFGPPFGTDLIIGSIESMYSCGHAVKIGAIKPKEIEGQTEKERL